MAARTVFVMLYIDAIEGKQRWLGPKHIYCMSNDQAALQDDEPRLAYGANAWRSGYAPIGFRWYADTTREPIRDETLRDAFVRVGAVVQRTGIATTSSYPRYALHSEFAALFATGLQGEYLEQEIDLWRGKYLDPLALGRIALLRKGATTTVERVQVTLPNGSIRQLAPGPSSIIAKAVVEVFAPTFLHQPAVVLLSESGEKIVAQEGVLLSAIGLQIEKDKLLPDLVLFDAASGQELLVFVEVVASDGPISEGRRAALLRMAEDARIATSRIAFVTAYLDRNHRAFRKTFGALAWNTFVWFVSEPNHIIVLREKPVSQTGRIVDLLA